MDDNSNNYLYYQINISIINNLKHYQNETFNDYYDIYYVNCINEL